MGNISTADENRIATQFRRALRGVASTVTIITANDRHRHHGMTATAVMPVSMAPPALVICIHRERLLHDILISAHRFCVNVLDEAQHRVSDAFSGGEASEDRFAIGTWSYDADGLGCLADAQANIFCTKAAAVPFGTHTLFVGEVTAVRSAERQAPLVYFNAAYCNSPLTPLSA